MYGNQTTQELSVIPVERQRKNQRTRVTATMIRHAAANLSSCVGRETNRSRMCEAIDIENKTISLLFRHGRQTRTLKAENTTAMVAKSKYKIPIGPWSTWGSPFNKIQQSCTVKSTRENTMETHPITTTLNPVEV